MKKGDSLQNPQIGLELKFSLSYPRTFRTSDFPERRSKSAETLRSLYHGGQKDSSSKQKVPGKG